MMVGRAGGMKWEQRRTMAFLIFCGARPEKFDRRRRMSLPRKPATSVPWPESIELRAGACLYGLYGLGREGIMVVELKTRESLLSALKRAAARPLTEEELEKQRVSFIVGS